MGNRVGCCANRVAAQQSRTARNANLAAGKQVGMVAPRFRGRVPQDRRSPEGDGRNNGAQSSFRPRACRLGWPAISMLPWNNSRRSRNFFLPIVGVVFLSCALARGQQADTQTGPPPDAPKASVAESKGFFARWAEFYRQDWWGTAASSPAAARRGLPSPLDSPPFPNSDWSYGGSPVIGEPDSNSYPLMTAINQARSRTKIYGWVDPTLNFSTSSQSNAPEANDVYSNRFEMNQFVLYAERLPDSVQRDHVDWGYHLTALYGTDYRYTITKGYISGQLLNDHHEYGFDPTLEYVDVYIPQVAQGLNLRLGRFI